MHWDGSQVGDGELEEDVVDDFAQEENSPRSNQLYMQEDLVTLTRRIFGDEDDKDDEAFWDDTDGAPWAATDHPAKDVGDGGDLQDQQSDSGGQSGVSEGKANKESKLDGLFGPTSDICLSTPSKDGPPRSHQDKYDHQMLRLCNMYCRQRKIQLQSTHRMA